MIKFWSHHICCIVVSEPVSSDLVYSIVGAMIALISLTVVVLLFVCGMLRHIHALGIYTIFTQYLHNMLTICSTYLFVLFENE